MTMKITEAKIKLYKLIKEKYPDLYKNGERDAILSHWLFNPIIPHSAIPETLYDEFVNGEKESCSDEFMVEDLESSYQTKFDFVMNDIPFPPPVNPKFTFIDLFAGIGGFRIAMQNLGGECIFSSEWDKYAQQTYETNFGETPYGDITKIDVKDIPKHDVLCAGFPCQPFSLAGVSKKNSMGRKHGFEDKTQGTLFFNVAKIIQEKQPKSFFLENVKNLLSHNKGETWKIIEETLNELGYKFFTQVVDGKKWVPQHRERIFIVGFRSDLKINKTFKIPIVPAVDYEYPDLKHLILDKVPDKYTLGIGTWECLKRHKSYHTKKGNGFGYGLHKIPIEKDAFTRTISARYHKDGAEVLIEQKGKRPRRLTINEAKQLQGYSKEFKFKVSDSQAYKQIGNSVVVPAIQATSENIIKNILED